ncbi:MAG: DsbE family thiol:disulfide interchange protein [Parvularculaceae bacterium]|nr:DsbE family thiol:disulfide interchange protein [Parvularculaceae bacterium]
MRRILFLAPLVAFAALAIYLAAGMGRDPSQIPSVLIDRPAPAFSLPAIEGRATGLSSDAFAGRVTLLNVFASWCVSCRIEHPQLMKIAQSREVALLGLNWKDKPGDGARWLAALGDPYEAIGNDADGRVAIDYGVSGAPETFVIDKKGRIRSKFTGPITPDIWEAELRPLIRRLNDEP